MIAQTLQEGFALANRRFVLIFLDMFWKVLWLAITVGMLLLALTWFGGRLQSVEWESTNIPALDTLIAGALLRQMWSAHARQFVLMLVAIALASAVAWLLLEA